MRLIDADELKDSLDGRNTDMILKLKVVRQINAMPTVDPVKCGHWITEKLSGYTVCSICGKSAIELDEPIRTKFCPNCGAKMNEVTK